MHFSTEMGEDWSTACGRGQGRTQHAVREAGRPPPALNHTFQAVFKTTTPFGWPRLCVLVSGPDFRGRTVAQAYGVVHYPGQKGPQRRRVLLFRPQPKSLFTGLLGWLNGCRAEVKDYEKVLAEGKGREVMRVLGVGQLQVEFQTSLVNFQEEHYL